MHQRSSEAIREEREDEILRLQDAAKIASIYHTSKGKFERRKDLTHVVHASLHCTQVIFNLSTDIFHHVHHYFNRLIREQDPTYPALTEEKNVIAFVYPLCMAISVVFAVLWCSKKILPRKPLIAFVICAMCGFTMLAAAILEMELVNRHIDITKILDDELLRHPIFIHNFVMCIITIFVMNLYFIQSWFLFDQWLWAKRQRGLPEVLYRASSSRPLRSMRAQEERGELHPIPDFDKFPERSSIFEDELPVEDEPIILYCCCVDCFNYIKYHYFEQRPVHEFQVIHVM